MEIILFIIGLLLGTWGFSVLVLPLVYGFPKAIYWTAKGLLRRSSALSYLIIPIIWMIVFVSLFFVLGKLTPNIVNRLSESSGFQGGMIGGFVLMIFRAFSKRGRRDLQEDFWSFVEKYIDTQHPEKAESNKFYLASQIAEQGAKFSIWKDYDYALKLFKKVIEIKEDYTDAYVGIAMIYQNKNNTTEAIKILESAPQEMKLGDQVIKDARLDIYKTLGMLYAISGEKEKAIKSLESALTTLKNPRIQQQLEIYKKADEIAASKGFADFFGTKNLEKQIEEMINELKREN